MENPLEEKKENKEHYTSGNKIGMSASVFALIHFVAFLFALYLAIRCHNGFEWKSFLVAFCCPYIYIVYSLAINNGICPPGAQSV